MQHGLPPGAHTSRSLTRGYELLLAPKAQPCCNAHPEMCREAWVLLTPHPGVSMGGWSPAFSLLSSITVIRWGQTGSRGYFPDPSRETEVPCHCYRHGAPGPLLCPQLE